MLNPGGGSVKRCLHRRAAAPPRPGEPDAANEAPEPIGPWRGRRRREASLRLELLEVAEEEPLLLLAVVFELDHHGRPLTTLGTCAPCPRCGRTRPSDRASW